MREVQEAKRGEMAYLMGNRTREVVPLDLQDLKRPQLSYRGRNLTMECTVRDGEDPELREVADGGS